MPIQYSTEARLPGPWLLEDEVLKQFDGVIDDEWNRLEGLRGSDFLMRWSQGVWSEERMIQAVNGTNEFFAMPYGPSSTAPEDDVREFELYFERLEAAGLRDVKRPDLLVFCNRSLGEGIIQKNGVRRGCTPPADTIFLGSYPLQVGELNGYVYKWDYAKEDESGGGLMRFLTQRRSGTGVPADAESQRVLKLLR